MNSSADIFDVPLSVMQLTDLFNLSLCARASEPGLEVDTGRSAATLSFGEIDARASRMARALAVRGIAAGDRVAVYLENRLEFLDLFLACLRLGAIFTPINILYRDREVAHILSDAAPSLAIADAKDLSRFPSGAPVVALSDLLADAARSSPDRVRCALDGDTPAAIIYTSGTTGQAKGAVLSHNNLLANTAAILSAWCITSADRYLAVLPLFHVHGLANGVCAWLASGCRMRLVRRFERDGAASLFDAFRPTLFFGVPTIYVRLLELDAITARRIGAGVRLFVSGSAPLPAAVLEAFRDRFGHTILERYGMSETLMLVSNPYVGERRAGTVGLPLPGVSVRLADAQGQEAGPGEAGEVLVRGSNVFSGYWRNEAATRGAFVDGWFRTGDIAFRSDDGYYTLCGRTSDLIISSGFNIYPREIEELLLELPGVRDAAVVGRPDAAKGEVPTAYVVTSGEFDAEAARAACARALASFKVPRAFVKVDALPRNALGKVQKHLLGRARGNTDAGST
jgi:malonyl-CoA/methylmalonyl-CoA synthetase